MQYAINNKKKERKSLFCELGGELTNFLNEKKLYIHGSKTRAVGAIEKKIE